MYAKENSKFSSATAQMTWDSLGPTMMELRRPAAALNEISKEYLCAIVQFLYCTDDMGFSALNEILMQ